MVKILKQIPFFITTLLLVGCSSFSNYVNLGHRAGADYFKNLPENSLVCLKASLAGSQNSPPIQSRRDFVYLEFDVRETADHELVVFHDKSLNRMIKRGSQKHKIRKMTLAELRKHRLSGFANDCIPTLKEFIQTCIDLKLTKPMVIEIKDIYSREALQTLFDLCDYYQDEYANQATIKYEPNFDFPKKPITLMSFPSNCYKTFGRPPKNTQWSPYLKQHGLDGVFQAMKHQVNLIDQ